MPEVFPALSIWPLHVCQLSIIKIYEIIPLQFIVQLQQLISVRRGCGGALIAVPKLRFVRRTLIDKGDIKFSPGEWYGPENFSQNTEHNATRPTCMAAMLELLSVGTVSSKK
ncbi:uncharacterized protein LOC124957510 [Vespa velutina]|uniref:uncharacterized protein LOC124957510 n=1 Tax=Vespa velutina TaxID=202808 RepID=UPI001FB350A2|nr:uncharacterized protein LOC124957510 [Vespa velutina]